MYSAALVWLRSLCASPEEFQSLRAQLADNPERVLGQLRPQHLLPTNQHDDEANDGPISWRLVGDMLAVDPLDRLSAAEALCHTRTADYGRDSGAVAATRTVLASDDSDSCEEDYSCRLPFSEDECLLDFGL